MLLGFSKFSIVFFMLLLAFDAVADENPYASPKAPSVNHVRESCAVFGAGVGPKVVDHIIIDVFAKIHRFTTGVSGKPEITLSSQSYQKVNHEKNTQIYVIHIPENISISDARKASRVDLAELKTFFENIHRRPLRNLSRRQVVICGLVSCFMAAGTGLSSEIMGEFIRSQTFSTILDRSSNASSAYPLSTGVFIGVATGVATFGKALSSDSTIQRAHKAALDEAIRDIKVLSESRGLQDQNSQFVVITHAHE